MIMFRYLNSYFKVLKILNKILEVANDKYHKHAKSQYENTLYFRLQKMPKYEIATCNFSTSATNFTTSIDNFTLTA
jgi:hypothetical protein